jgi:hypothetical protein
LYGNIFCDTPTEVKKLDRGKWRQEARARFEKKRKERKRSVVEKKRKE